jgi:hypothetical protein
VVLRAWAETMMDPQLRQRKNLASAEPSPHAKFGFRRAIKGQAFIITAESVIQLAFDDRPRAGADGRMPTIGMRHWNPGHAHRRQHQLASEALKRRGHVNNGGRKNTTPREISPDRDIPITLKTRIAVRDEIDRVTRYFGTTIARAWYSGPGFEPPDRQACLRRTCDPLFKILASPIRGCIIDNHQFERKAARPSPYNRLDGLSNSASLISDRNDDANWRRLYHRQSGPMSGLRDFVLDLTTLSCIRLMPAPQAELPLEAQQQVCLRDRGRR